MKKLNKYIMLFVAAFALVGCVDDVIDTPSTEIMAGEEVQFGLSLPTSRTIYGTENSIGFPVYWSDGDKVLVASPQSPNGRNSAVYNVTPVPGQSYASAMTSIGDSAVQWGSEATANFYSVYPSDGASWTSLTASNVTAKLNIGAKQMANLVLDNTNHIYSAADMSNVIMYAVETDVANGSTVELNYKPYSTTLEFELNIVENEDEQSNKTGFGSLKIQSITLTAPSTTITGDFTLAFDGDTPTVKAAGNNGNTITLEFATQPVIDGTNQVLKAKMALIPLSGVTSLKGWTVTVTALEGDNTQKTFTKTLGDTDALVPGQVHKVKLPKFSSKTAWKPDMTKWITQLYDYKNIYLTELSLPGAWYAGAPTSEDYQATDNISTLWKAGVRAFAMECRSNSNYYLVTASDPNSVVISGTGNNGAGAYYGGTTIRGTIKNIADAVAATVTTDATTGVVTGGEYAVLVLSYADGGSGGHRDVDHAYFINGIKTEIAKSSATNIVTTVSKDTTVGDVLGKLIIKINVDDDIPLGSYTTQDMNALFSYNPFMQQLPADTVENADGTTTTMVDYTKIRFSKLSWKNWANANKVFAEANNNDFLWCFSSANRTQKNTGTNTTIPTYAQRQTALNEMIEHSKEISEVGSHNVWFYFNAGGTETTSVTDKNTSGSNFATTMNPWLLKVINRKANGGTNDSGEYVESEPSSMGLVFFNYCTSESSAHNGPAIIEAIVNMNNKFKLQRATTKARSDYDGTLTTGGNAY